MSKLFPDRESVHRLLGARQVLGGAALLGLFLASAPALATLVPKQHPVQGGAALRLANEGKPPRGTRTGQQKPPQGRPVLPSPAAPSPTAVTTTAPVVNTVPVVTTAPVVTPPVVSAPVSPASTHPGQGGGGGLPVQGEAARFTSQAVPPATTPSPLAEVLPRNEVLVASMKDLGLPPDGLRAPEVAASPSCVAVTLSRDDRRANSTLVDLTGDGLIVTPVDNQRLQAVLDRAALNVALSGEPVRHCLPQSVVRDMVRPVATAERPSMVLVQTRQGWRLAPGAAPSAAASSKRTSVVKAPASRPTPLPRPVASR